MQQHRDDLQRLKDFDVLQRQNEQVRTSLLRNVEALTAAV